MEDIEDLEVCIDCGLVVANADYGGIENQSTIDAVDKGIEEWSAAGYHLVISCPTEDCECISFTWALCDCCGSSLGGSRYHAVALSIGGTA